LDKPQEKPAPVIIPYQDLSPAALRGLIESFVLREGTEYGPKDVPLDIKRGQVMRLLERGTAQIVFNPVLDSADIEVVQAGDRRRK
jgi:hypothetical protein